MEEMIYLDNAATTFPKPDCVFGSMEEANRRLSFNAGRGSYACARKAAELFEQLREALLELANGKENADIIITPSATIAMNQIIGGLSLGEDAVVYLSPFEHNAVVRPLRLLCPGVQIEELPLREESVSIDLEKMEYLFSRKPPTHVFLSHVSNVTGYILPVEQVVHASKIYNALTVLDASQSFGLLSLNLMELPVDFLVFAGHKSMYGPFGIGGFLMRKGSYLKPYLAGGTGSDSLSPFMPEDAPGRYEPGSPDITAGAGLLAALMELKASGGGSYSLAVEQSRQAECQRICRWAEGLSVIPGIRLYLPPRDCHISMVSFNISGYQASEVGRILDEDYRIAVRAGYHCAPLIHKALKDECYGGTVRASIGRFTTEEDWEALVKALKEIAMG